jgi:hypothetical protein
MSNWIVNEQNIESSLSQGLSILLYGDTGDGKTSLVGEYAEDKFKRTGLITRLYTADPGGWRGLIPYVKLGIIEVINLVGMPRPWEWISEVTKGKLPVGVGTDGMPLWHLDAQKNAKVGVYAFEGGTAFGDILMQDMSKRNAEGQVIGPQPPNFRVSEGNAKWAGTSPSQFGSAQTVLTIAIQESFRLPGDVIWTCMARRAGDADTTAPILGPQFVGKALTSDAPRWFVYTFRVTTVPGNEVLKTKTEHRLYIEDHAEVTTGVGPDGKPAMNAQKSLGNSRMPLDGDEIAPFVSPASVVEAIRLIDQGGSTALAKIRARVAAARSDAA